MSKAGKITGWALSLLLALFLGVASAGGKFADFQGKTEMFDKMGWKTDVMFTIGIVEVVCTLLFLIPQTAFIGAVLLTAYLGGAVATHVRIGDNFIFPIIMGIVMWIALGLRDGRVFGLAFSTQKSGGSPAEGA